MSRHIGLFYTSHHGQTRKIVGHLERSFVAGGATVSVTDIRKHPRDHQHLRDCDTVLIGAPLYAGRYPREVRRFVRAHRDVLAAHRSTGLFSVSLTASMPTLAAHVESIGPLRAWLSDIAWTPDWVASFAGALNYTEYNPLIRYAMRRISAHYGGPTDTARDYELTRWDEVTQFARDVAEDRADSPYRSTAMSLPARSLGRLLPQWEHRITASRVIRATPAEIRSSFDEMLPSDMPLAEMLARIRNFGRSTSPAATRTSFGDAARAFEMVPIEHTEPNQVIGGLAGKFWEPAFGINRLPDENAFVAFADPSYTKVVTDFWFDDVRERGTTVRTETRIHSVGHGAARRFSWYWLLLSPGIRLYMRSVLRGLARAAERRRARPSLTAERA